MNPAWLLTFLVLTATYLLALFVIVKTFRRSETVEHSEMKTQVVGPQPEKEPEFDPTSASSLEWKIRFATLGFSVGVGTAALVGRLVE